VIAHVSSRVVCLIAGLGILVIAAGCAGGSNNVTTYVAQVSGTVTFERVPATATGLDYDEASIIDSPARGVLVEALVRGSPVASTYTDDAGAYALTVETTGLSRAEIRVSSIMDRSFGALVEVYRNGEVVDVVEAVIEREGAVVMDFDLESGWTGAGYGNERVAGAFAMAAYLLQGPSIQRTMATPTLEEHGGL